MQTISDIEANEPSSRMNESSRIQSNRTSQVEDRTSVVVGLNDSNPHLQIDGSKEGTRSISEIKGEQSIGFLDLEFGHQQNKWQKLNPFSTKNLRPEAARHSVVFSATESATRLTFGQQWCPWFDENSRMREEFKREMRILSRLRHPGNFARWPRRYELIFRQYPHHISVFFCFFSFSYHDGDGRSRHENTRSNAGDG